VRELSLPPQYTVRTSHTSSVVDGQVFVIGGKNSHGIPVAIVDRLVIREQQTPEGSWELIVEGDPLPPQSVCPHALHGHSAAVLRQEVFVFGGRCFCVSFILFYFYFFLLQKMPQYRLESHSIVWIIFFADF
jgi:hypothetical protein